jgi:hypothetical protein
VLARILALQDQHVLALKSLQDQPGGCKAESWVWDEVPANQVADLNLHAKCGKDLDPTWGTDRSVSKGGALIT